MPIWNPVKEWEGQDAYCIGGGPSLLDFNWDLLHGKNTIGCNAAYKLPYEVIKIVFFADLGFWHKNSVQLAQRRGRVFTNCPALKEKLPYPNVFWLPRKREGLWEDGLGFGGSSGSSVINLALLLGAKRVFLLGYDNRNETDDSGTRSHWHSHYSGKITQQSSLDRFNQGMKTIAAHLKEGRFRGSQVINLCPDSAIECFPKAHYSEYLKDGIYNTVQCC